MGSRPRSRAIVGRAVARIVESVFSMKSAVATTSGTIGMFMASGPAHTRRLWRAQHLSSLHPPPGDLGGDRIRRGERCIAPGLQALERIGQRPRGAMALQGLVEARELG